MALTLEEFQREYFERYLRNEPKRWQDNRMNTAKWFFNAIIPSFNPGGKHIYYTETCQTEGSSNSKLVQRLLEINGGKFVVSFPECDSGVYWGEGYCDYISKSYESSPSITGLLREVEEKDITLLLFYREGHTMFHCEHSFLNPSPDCPELVEVKRLRELGKKIIKFPLGETCYVQNRPNN